MSDQNKFEKMLELLVNEDKAAAEELFHEIVVEKSRDIYESLLEDEAEVDEADDEEVDESDEDLDEADDEEVDESDEDLDENFSLDTFEVEADDEPFGGDKTDDLANDLGMEMPGEEGDDDMGDAEDDADVEDRVEDLEDALDDLKAEFEKMMAGDDEGEDDGEEADDDAEDDMDMDAEEPEEEAMAFEAADEEVDESDEEVEEDTTEKSASETMREYVEKVTATMGDNGVNGKSAVAKPNNMGGTSANIAKNAVASDPEAGAGSTVKGSALSDTSAKDIGTGNVNVPGGKAAKAGKTVPAGHGAEKKGAGETADKAAGSTLNKLSKRAK
jgi:hypothetical protein